LNALSSNIYFTTLKTSCRLSLWREEWKKRQLFPFPKNNKVWILFSGSLIFSTNWLSFFWYWRGKMPFTCVYNSNIEEPFRVLHARNRRCGHGGGGRGGGVGVKKRVPSHVCSTRFSYIITTKRALNLFLHPWIFLISIMQSNDRDDMCRLRSSSKSKCQRCFWRIYRRWVVDDVRGERALCIVKKICNTHKHAHNGWRKKM